MKSYGTVLKVMISSTVLDLPEHRTEAIKAIGRCKMQPLAMEFLVPMDETPVTYSLHLADEADVYVGVFAHRYGEIPEGYESSITELEYRRAVERGIPIIVFIIDDQHPLIISQIDTDPQRVVRLAKLKEELRGRYVVGSFRSPQELGTNIFEALTAFKEKLSDAYRSNGAQVTRAQTPAERESDEAFILQAYLSWLVRKHNVLELRGIRKAGQLPTLPLDRVYVALKADLTSPSERAESRSLIESEWQKWESLARTQDLSPEERRSHRWRLLASAPLMPSLAERDYLRQDDGSESRIVTLAGAVQRFRWLVVLGDPGSGKSTLGRWLAWNFARSLLNRAERVLVPANHVDPSAAAQAPLVDLGPARLPILLRVADFADAKEINPSLALADYLGYQPWLGEVPMFGTDSGERQGDKVPPDKLNLLIKLYLRKGRAIVILDGVDEVTGTDTRDQTLRAIESFLSEWIRTPDGRTPFEIYPSFFMPMRPDVPAAEGGNQVIITSRIAGYHVAPLSGRLAHVTIEPMTNAGIDSFVEAWSQAVHSLLADVNDSQEEVTARAALEAQSLKSTLHDPNRRGVAELASNPLLLTILAIVHHNSQARLPEQRVRLYQLAIENLVEVWRDTGLTEDEVIHVLSPLAAHIHQNYATGLVEEAEVRSIVTQHLANYRGINPNSPPPSFRITVTAFLNAVRERVGLLAARGEYLYGFLHLSFQEYLAARYLVRDPATAKNELLMRIADPRWREPILLALGFVSWTWGPTARERLLSELLESAGVYNDMLPQNTLIVSAALPELVHVPVHIVTEVIQRLLAAYGRNERLLGDSSLLSDQIEATFRSLYRGEMKETVNSALVVALSSVQENPPVTLLAAAKIIDKLKWYEFILAEALARAANFDHADWGWPVSSALSAIASSHPEFLPSAYLRFREMLGKNSSLSEHIATSANWLSMVLFVYGGLDDRLRFKVSRIFRDSRLTPYLIAHLRAPNTAYSLTSTLRHHLARVSDEREKIDTILALAALGEKIETLLDTNSQETTTNTARTAISMRRQYIVSEFGDTAEHFARHAIVVAAALAPALEEQDRIVLLTVTIAHVRTLCEISENWTLDPYAWAESARALVPFMKEHDEVLSAFLSLTTATFRYATPSQGMRLAGELGSLNEVLRSRPEYLSQVLSWAATLPAWTEYKSLEHRGDTVGSQRITALGVLYPALSGAHKRIASSNVAHRNHSRRGCSGW